ncbi:L-cystine import ATP-binding protein TcyC [Caloramator mitchellensis]|uniref:L-cystine import ATP-binding protein TcyC n=1 Tax=Caloramator mitchellensis TaxID=908809 RepID=A0A0R3JRG9_CALMK|nr:ABC transporter ATP-binding protein [Caloramator mitchellensis]KRQ86083.1 L-cystine import ATP-binding protein TcyC [Caloramator mitchellensis]
MFRFENVKYRNILDIKKLIIEEGKINCIVGESGSGKTTALRLLNKMISCNSGEIYYKDKLIENWDSVLLRREVVMTPQVPVMFNGDIRENLLIGLKYSGKDLVDDERLIEVMKIVNLNKSLDEEVQNLSGGEKQRVALARVLVMEPEVYVFDEPSSALDDGTEEKIIGNIVQYVKNKNKTLIMVTHSKSLVNKFAEKVIEIDKGRIVGGEI